ncbi:radical SAM family heme chaperone HemW [Caviibacter abscessus]|uniref:radical SAM family heme chaperone HemW n=1 Tax=Caviibacter abscessus TaxID=1766719 RepID=UPI00082D2293|nr:radical SAM family heme chaperone HemW [Caviibacter abscessus]
MVNSIYIHIPFCNRKCSYCDFYILTNMSNMYDKYVEYLIKEINLYPKYKYDTIYFGGGTPSVLSVSQIKQVLSNLDYDKNTEITLELNPTDMDCEKLKELRKIGINRLSIGMQSFNDDILSLMNREHNSSDSIKTYYDARKAGFDNISIDLIFAVPSQSMKDLAYDLDKVKELNPEHISIYSLIWEDGSRFSKLLKEKKIEKLDDDTEANMFVYVMDNLIKQGYEHYEISSFCKNKKYGRHNMKYWNNEEFIGVGISASSFYNNKRYEKERKLLSYYKKIDENIIPINERTVENVNKNDLKELEYMLGLRRLNKGIRYYEEDKDKINKLIKEGLIEKKEDRIYLTKKGILLGDTVILELI